MPLLISVPYSDKDEAKRLGAKWNPDLKSWYVESRRDYYKFIKWILSGKDEVNILSSEFYILQRNRICYKCNKITPVYALVFPSYFTVCDMEKTDAMVPISYQDDFYIISSFPDLTDEVLKQIDLKYCYKDYSKTVKDSYIANHCCNCNAIQGNHPLFCEEDSPFSLDNIVDDLVNHRTGVGVKKVNIGFDFIANLEYFCIDYNGIIDEIVS